jgi:hypothetical protein
MVKKKPAAPRTAESSAKTDIVTGVTAAAISRRAYSLFQAHGGEHGRDVEDWLLAEAELREGHTTADRGGRRPIPTTVTSVV